MPGLFIWAEHSWIFIGLTTAYNFTKMKELWIYIDEINAYTKRVRR